MGYNKEWYLKNREKKLEQNTLYNKTYSKTKMGRALRLLGSYNVNDIKYSRGKGDLTAKWLVDNILSKPCAHCGESDWRKIGCNRLDDSKPHTMDNVEPCCRKCNHRLHIDSMKKRVLQCDLYDNVVKIWESTMECGRNGFTQGCVAACCRNEYTSKKINTYKGYRWFYEDEYEKMLEKELES